MTSKKMSRMFSRRSLKRKGTTSTWIVLKEAEKCYVTKMVFMALLFFSMVTSLTAVLATGTLKSFVVIKAKTALRSAPANPSRMLSIEMRGNSNTMAECGRYYRGECVLKDSTDVQYSNNCAIVGNSGILTDSLCGKEIDSNDYVIRLNLAPTHGYEKDVGYKTNLTVLNKSLMRKVKASLALGYEKDLYSKRLRLLNGTTFCFPKEGDKLALFGDFFLSVMANNIIITMKHYPYNLEHLTASIMKRILRQGQFGQPTTGMIAVVMATTFCSRINLYGYYPFPKDQANRTIPYHYFYDVKKAKPDKRHNFLTEFRFHQLLHKDRVLRLVTTKCS
ncbi:PREDICTED: CMP-N-acetylneuraminate-poly-alpha-2,8-sialyltransferase-like [Branchiostoma belcheri]|uniref:CMP-N-acetylneuraminate-poly-alpha-2, 8-sialyltransferase-like n=1 Tax=Branchiostoma belcheri TaxID=7741 RepID=A0A6P4ZSZ6_BRABE|nr:PREDICTED: CMP-N-acetylneuraminate-poly-alpha-2,8-sialyltransferase-like [Branchiostoma belcheri]